MDKKYYIVSFGNSDEYSVAFSGSREELIEAPCFRKIIDELRKCLDKEFPAENAGLLLTPKIREATPADRNYPELNNEAVRNIRHTLKKEGEVMMADRKLNSNAPYAET